MDRTTKNKTALITGVGGQDGCYLSKLLLEKGYRVFGSVRNASKPDLSRLSEFGIERDVQLIDLDLCNKESIRRAIELSEPDEIYNLAALSSVANSFDNAAEVGIVGGIAVARIIDVIRHNAPAVRFYQASSSEIFGESSDQACSEKTAFNPKNPYAIAKLYGHLITRHYRESYRLHATSGILFNHESPLRGDRFVTRKITKGIAAIHAGHQDSLVLGNLDAVRDWGHARDYVEGMWLMLQQPMADDYVLATGSSHSVRQFVECAFSEIGVELAWEGSASEEIGIDRKNGQTRVKVDPAYFRVSEVNRIVGNPAKARQQLGWMHRTNFDQLVREMLRADLQRLTENKK